MDEAFDALEYEMDDVTWNLTTNSLQYLQTIEVISERVPEPLPRDIVEKEVRGRVQGGRQVAEADEDIRHGAGHRLGKFSFIS